jgi:hypothetical protein
MGVYIPVRAPLKFATVKGVIGYLSQVSQHNTKLPNFRLKFNILGQGAKQPQKEYGQHSAGKLDTCFNNAKTVKLLVLGVSSPVHPLQKSGS